MEYERNLNLHDEPPGPMCRNLRSKSMFVVSNQEVTAEHGQEASGNCWCEMTQYVYGPDEQIVGRYECGSNRTCYEAKL